MAKYIESQTRKMLSAYGGVGSLLESTVGALQVLEFDKWPFFEQAGHSDPDFEAKDERLLRRLQFKFRQLRRLIRVPTTIQNFTYKSGSLPDELNKVAKAEYFPKWMYCNKCERFKPYKEWLEGWRSIYKGDDAFAKFVPPVCFECYREASGKKVKKFYELEQVRFVMTSPAGHMRDIPWERWNRAEKITAEDDSESGTVRLDYENLCCEKQDLRYKKSSSLSDLSGVRIRCENCKTEKTLAGLFGLRGNWDKSLHKPVIRSSNSVYYPLLMSSLYLPTNGEINPADEQKIKGWAAKGKDIVFIFEALEERYSQASIEWFLKKRNEQEDEFSFESEQLYRLGEYHFLLENPDFKDRSNCLICAEQDNSSLLPIGIQRLIQIRRLKMTTVQTGYTRQQAMDRDLFMGQEPIAGMQQVRVKYTSKNELRTEVLPAVENYGEGIFISFETARLTDWLDQIFLKEPGLGIRTEDLLRRIRSDEMLQSRYAHRFPNARFWAKFVLLHTFSHLLVKELEFLCGYPATSLQERLYCDQDQMAGLLIYTVAGAEGSYGGLVSQAMPVNFKKIVDSALHRATDCASDPVCLHSEGQGIGGLNFAACYSCTLLPETSCEEFNSFLDRALVIGEEIGFFRHISN